jgi:uncharacterized membrane protein
MVGLLYNDYNSTMKRFESGEWIIADLGNFSLMLGAIMFAMAAIYCSFVIAFACQLEGDFEAMVWKSMTGITSSFGVIMFMIAIIPLCIVSRNHHQRRKITVDTDTE